MKLLDTFKIAFHNLWIRKLRTALNLVGIVLSCVLLMCTFAATNGITRAVERFVESSEHAKKFRIWPGYDRSVQPPEDVIKVEGQMSERRRMRIQNLLEDQWRSENQRQSYMIRYSQLDAIRNLPHVADVNPDYSLRIDAAANQKSQVCVMSSHSLFDRSLPERIIAGTNISQNNLGQILIHEGLAYQLGFRSDAELDALIGHKITLKFQNHESIYSIFGPDFFSQSVEQQARWRTIIEHFVSGKSLSELDPDAQALILNAAKEREKSPAITPKSRLVEKEYEVCGVYRQRDELDIENILDRYTTGMDQILIHYSVLEDEFQEMLPKLGVHNADVYVDDYQGLKEVVPQVKKMSVNASAPTDIIDRIIYAVDRSKLTVMGIVAIVLFISAVGISNTMIISLIERTEEIGIMKAVGARNSHVMLIILMEGVVTGLIGGIVSIAISLIVTMAGNEILRSYVVSRSSMELEGPVFELQFWMIAIGVCLSVAITTIAGIWPAWRAARLDPVKAMGQQ